MRSVLVLAIALSLLAACGGDESTTAPADPDAPADTTRLAGTFVRASDGAGHGPLEVTLFDLRRLTTVGRTVADSSGRFAFVDVPDGDFLPVLVSDDVALFGLPRPRFTFTGTERFDEIFPVAPVPGGLNPSEEGVAGTVLDAETGAPIPFARVEMSSSTGAANWSQESSNWSEFRGSASEQEPVTDPRGRFRIQPVPMVALPGDRPGEFRRIVPSWRVTAPGYRARSFPATEAIGGVRQVTVRLEPGVDEATIEGRVVGLDGTPRAGVRVFAEWRRAPGELFRGDDRLLTGIPGTSGADGRFRIEGLAPGVYNVLAGALPDDGWVGPAAPVGTNRPGRNLGGLTAVEVQTTTDVGDLVVEPVIDGFAPAPGDTLRRTIVLRFDAVPGAALYQVRVRRGTDLVAAVGETERPEIGFDSPNEPFDTDALFRLEIRAEDAEGHELSRTDRPVLYRWVAGDPASR